MVIDGDTNAVEISLAENVMRDDMHPADEFEAIRVLVDKGMPVTDIAARFGRDTAHVRQLLKLARVSPAVLKAYRRGDLTLEQVMAFAVSDDHAAQERVLEALRPHSRDPRSIRAALTEGNIPATDRRVKYVTLKAYEEAGGKLLSDMFSDSVFLLDGALLDRLAEEKLARAVQRVAKEGWKWTESFIDFSYDRKAQFHRIHAEPAPLPPKLAAKAETLTQELDALREAWEAREDAEEPARMAEIEKRLEAIEAQRREPVWTAEQLAIAGAVVSIGYDGKTEILRGLVKPEDMPARKPKKAITETGEGVQSPALSAALTEDLTAQRSAALAASLEQSPSIALAAVVHALACPVLFTGTSGSVLQIAVTPQSLQRAEGAKACLHMDAAREEWLKAVPATPDDLWTWCLAQKQAVLLKLLAFCAAASVNAVQGKSDRAESGRLRHANALAAALTLDMKDWFAPDAANYFSRVSKPQILDALKAARSQPPAPAWEKLKKDELAALAAREIVGTGWLPEVLSPAA
jgi:ParB family chromosome partitioning protein